MREIRLRDETGAFRVIYIASFKEGIYVLHCFQKKERATAKTDIAIATVRYQAVVRARRTRKS